MAYDEETDTPIPASLLWRIGTLWMLSAVIYVIANIPAIIIIIIFPATKEIFEAMAIICYTYLLGLGAIALIMFAYQEGFFQWVRSAVRVILGKEGIE